MKNVPAVRLAIGLIAFFLFAAAVNAKSLSNNVASGSSDDFDSSPCQRFAKENVFDSFEKAFRAPEKVKCLSPNFEGADLEMKRLPTKISTLVNLEVFSFGCLEKLESLPESLGNLRKLEEIIVDNGNGCTMNITLPRSIGKLENLRVLRLYGAISTPTLPAEIANLRKLEILDLGRNGLATVPTQIAALSNLKTLRLEYNSLRAVPAFIGNFKNLKELSLDANGKLANLPPSFAKLKGLKVSMGNNSLKLRDQKRLRSSFPAIVFTFENEYDDAAANEETAKPKSKPRPKRKG